MTTAARDYHTILQQAKALTQGETHLISNLANVAALLKTLSGYFWVGFYIVDGNELVLGPFQGPVACTRIAYGKGVCGTAWKQNTTIVVPDVHLFPGHIACNAASKSEIVVPVRNQTGAVTMVIDVDSDQPNNFGPDDAAALENLARLIGGLHAI